MAESLSTLSSTGTEGSPTGNGARYTSFQDWENAAQGQHTVGTQTVLEGYKGTSINGGWQSDGSLNGSVTISGWTNVTAQDNIIIRAAQGNEHDGTLYTGFTVYSNDTGATINQSTAVNFIDHESLCIINTSTGAAIINPQTCTLKNCIYYAPGNTANAMNQTSRITMENCLVVCGGRGMDIRVGPSFVRSSTVICATGTGDFGILTDADTTVTNTVVYGFSNEDIFGDAGTYSYLAVSDTSVTGTGVIQNITSAAFADYPDDYSPEPSGDLDGTGTDLSIYFTDDIAGATRTVPWAIGAYIVAGGPPPVGIQEMYIKDGGIFVKYTPYVKVGGTFQEVGAYVLEGGTWKPVHEK